MRILRTTGIAAGLVAAGTMIGASITTLASVFDWSTTPATNATADPNINWAEGMLPSQVNDSARATMAALSAYVRDAAGVPTLGGTGNAFTITGSQPMQAWTPGFFGFKATRSNTGAVTMSRDGLTPKPLRALSGVDLVSGQILIGAEYIATYSAGTDEVLLIGKTAITASDSSAVPALTVRANLTGSAASPTDATLAAFFGAAPSASLPFSALGAIANNSIPVSAVSGLTGLVATFYGSSCPTGWLTADGTNGTVDMRGEFARGLDNGAGRDPGRALGSFQGDLLRDHTHQVTNAFPLFSGNAAPGAAAAGFNGSYTNVTVTSGGVNGGLGGGETRPINIALLYCQKS